MQPGQAEQRTHDYVRHGTTTLFAALEIATGQVTGVCKPRHRHHEFLVFLRHLARGYPDQQLHLIMDNYAAHKHPKVKAWLAANPRIHIHFTPTSGSWLNLVEVWFGIIERQAIHRGHLSLRPRPHDQDPTIHRRLERPQAPIHLDQDRRPDPGQNQP
jgi:DDE superfamily endonuclease